MSNATYSKYHWHKLALGYNVHVAVEFRLHDCGIMKECYDVCCVVLIVGELSRLISWQYLILMGDV